MYEQFEHTADVGLRVRAADRASLFREAAEGLQAMIASPSRAGRPRRGRPVELEIAGTRDDWLLFDWLSELLVRFETRRELLERIEVELHAGGLRARAVAVPFDPSRDRPGREVKAVTYHGLVVRPVDDGWLAEVVLDI